MYKKPVNHGAKPPRYELGAGFQPLTGLPCQSLTCFSWNYSRKGDSDLGNDQIFRVGQNVKIVKRSVVKICWWWRIKRFSKTDLEFVFKGEWEMRTWQLWKAPKNFPSRYWCLLQGGPLLLNKSGLFDPHINGRNQWVSLGLSPYFFGGSPFHKLLLRYGDPSWCAFLEKLVTREGWNLAPLGMHR